MGRHGHRVEDRRGVVLSGRYRVEALLGVGAAGSVWSATDLRSGAPCVAKICEVAVLGASLEVGVARFLLEAKALGAIRHPYVVRLLGLGRMDDGRPFLVMERLVGRSVGDYMAQAGPLPLPEALGIAGALASALHAVHQTGLIHRDVKPENVFLAQQPGGDVVPKLLDFGLVRVADNRTGITRSGSPLGTPGFMSPEQALGERDVDHRTDVFAAGALLYAMLSGHLPYDAKGDAALIIATATQDPVPLARRGRELPEQVHELVMRALARDRQARFATAAALHQAIAGALDDVPGRSSTVPPPAPEGWETMQGVSPAGHAERARPLASPRPRAPASPSANRRRVPGREPD